MQWILLEEAELSEREKQLVALLTQQEQARSLNPWYSYLVEGKGQAPQTFKKIQLVLLSSFLFSAGKPSFLAGYDADSFSQLSDGDSGRSSGLCFVLQQDKYTSVRAILSDTIEAVEYDFGLRSLSC